MSNAAESTKTSFVNPGTAERGALQVGERLSMTSYLTVMGIRGAEIAVEDHRGVNFVIKDGHMNEGSLVNQTMHSATLVKDTVKKNRTELVETMLKTAGDAVMQVTFHKQVDALEAFEAIKSGNVLKSHAEQKKALKEALKGEERVLNGYMLTSENTMGRTLFYDLDAKAPRWVDHRTITSLILKGIKYQVIK